MFDGQPYSRQPGTVPFLPQKITDAPIDTCVGLRTFLVWGGDIDNATFPKYCEISQSDKILKIVSTRNCHFALTSWMNLNSMESFLFLCSRCLGGMLLQKVCPPSGSKAERLLLQIGVAIVAII